MTIWQEDSDPLKMLDGAAFDALCDRLDARTRAKVIAAVDGEAIAVPLATGPAKGADRPEQPAPYTGIWPPVVPQAPRRHGSGPKAVRSQPRGRSQAPVATKAYRRRPGTLARLIGLLLVVPTALMALAGGALSLTIIGIPFGAALVAPFYFVITYCFGHETKWAKQKRIAHEEMLAAYRWQ